MMVASLPCLCKTHTLKKDVVLKTRHFSIVVCMFLLLSNLAGQTEEQSTYIIKKGDCLWDIAFKFLGDPFKWPQIWHQNPYIKDPNLIFPNNTLIIGPGQQVMTAAQSSVSASPYSSQQDSFGSVINQDLENAKEQSGGFYKKTRSKEGVSAWDADSLFRVSIRRKNYFTSEFLWKIAFLWFKKDEKGLIYPGKASIMKTDNSGMLKKYENQVFSLYDEIVLEPIGSAAFHAGDTLDILHSDQFIRVDDKIANVVRRTAKAYVTSIDKNRIHAVLCHVGDVVQNEDRADTTTHFPDLFVDTIVTPDVVIVGAIVQEIEGTERPYLYHSFIINKGSKDGVMLGDLFAVFPRISDSKRPSAFACALYVGETFSTLVIINMFDNNINQNDKVSLIRRMKFR